MTAIIGEQIHLEEGPRPSTACMSTARLPASPIIHRVFTGNWITLQRMQTCQPAFSVVLIAYVESAFDEETEKNNICVPISRTPVLEDWLHMLRLDFVKRQIWRLYPRLSECVDASRLSPLKLHYERFERDSESVIQVDRYLSNVNRTGPTQPTSAA
jgi:hypothetical protein